MHRKHKTPSKTNKTQKTYVHIYTTRSDFTKALLLALQRFCIIFCVLYRVCFIVYFIVHAAFVRIKLIIMILIAVCLSVCLSAEPCVEADVETLPSLLYYVSLPMTANLLNRNKDRQKQLGPEAR